MKFLFAAFLLACVALTIEGKCFQDGAKEEVMKEIKEKFAPVKEACKKENADADDVALKVCTMNKLKTAAQECKKDKPDAKKKEVFLCVCEKLGITPPTEEEMKFENVKAKFVSKAEDKEAVGAAFDGCKDEEDFKCCALKKLAEGPCPEIKGFVEKMSKFKEEMES